MLLSVDKLYMDICRVVILERPMTMLDDLDYIHSIDKSNMLRVIETFPEQLLEALSIVEQSKIRKTDGREINNIVVAAVGGSAIQGDLIRNWTEDEMAIPLEVCRDSTLPSYADRRTLVIAVSYSGDTQETLSQVIEAYEKRCKVFSVTSGGQLAMISKKLGVPTVKVRSGLVPRAALPHLLTSTAHVLWRSRLIKSIQEEIKLASRQLSEIRREIRADSPLQNNSAKQFAIELLGKFPVIYSSARVSGVARRMKNQFNENSKVLSKFELLPEAIHNEIEGWKRLDVAEEESMPFSIIFIRDSEESKSERIRFEEMKKLLNEAGVSEVKQIPLEGETKLGRLLSGVYFGDFVSFYLAVARGFDPTPIRSIEKLKKRIDGRLRFKVSLEKRVREL